MATSRVCRRITPLPAAGGLAVRLRAVRRCDGRGLTVALSESGEGIRPMISRCREMGCQRGSPLWDPCVREEMKRPGRAWHSVGTCSTSLAPPSLPGEHYIK